jgi:hypothetical protein
MNDVHYITLQLPLSVSSKDVGRKCMIHGGFQWASRSLILLLLLKASIKQSCNNLEDIRELQVHILLIH